MRVWRMIRVEILLLRRLIRVGCRLMIPSVMRRLVVLTAIAVIGAMLGWLTCIMMFIRIRLLRIWRLILIIVVG